MIDTDRLTLRPWRDADREPFHAMCQDPEVMQHLGPPLGRTECDAAVDRMMALQSGRGHCFWAVERKSDFAFLGFCGLKIATDEGPVCGDVEIGWRLRRDAWGKGYAREAARASLDWGFANLPVGRIVAMTVDANRRSWNLMEWLGMSRRPDLDFAHPRLPEGHPLRPHIVYVIDRTTA